MRLDVSCGYFCDSGCQCTATLLFVAVFGTCRCVWGYTAVIVETLETIAPQDLCMQLETLDTAAVRTEAIVV